MNAGRYPKASRYPGTAGGTCGRMRRCRLHSFTQATRSSAVPSVNGVRNRPDFGCGGGSEFGEVTACVVQGGASAKYRAHYHTPGPPTTARAVGKGPTPDLA